MPRMPTSATSTPAGSPPRSVQPAGDLDAEPVVGEEDVADAGHQDPVHRSSRLHGPPPARRAGSSGSGRARAAARRPGRRPPTRRRAPRRRRRAPPPARWRAGRRGTRSWASAAAAAAQHDRAALGHRRRRRPAPSRCPGRPRRRRRGPTTGALRRRDGGASAPAGRRGDRRVVRRSQRADRAVQPLQISGGMRVDRVDDRRGPRVGRPGLGLLLVGEHQRAQGEDLVDLGAVEQVRSCSPGRAAGGRRG